MKYDNTCSPPNQVALAVGYEGQQLRLPEEDTERFPAKLKKLILQCWDKVSHARRGRGRVAGRRAGLRRRDSALIGPRAEGHIGVASAPERWQEG